MDNHASRNDLLLADCIPFMTVPALQSYAEVSPTTARWVATHLDEQLNTALTDYVYDPIAFRSALRLTQSVISGSFALWFLLHGQERCFKPADLNIYVPCKYGRRFADYLITAEGYKLCKTQAALYAGFRRVAHSTVLVLQRASTRIDVVVSSNDSALYPLSHFWASHLMNYISSDSYCVAYPDLTFARRGRAPVSVVSSVIVFVSSAI
ncbi:hypothetical protein OH77DRAFT_1562849 [Trametes cingulata]|nr:hypothetical protein OH77DRAFT_1562849 [Trametes cingulata]